MGVVHDSLVAFARLGAAFFARPPHASRTPPNRHRYPLTANRYPHCPIALFISINSRALYPSS